MREIRVSAGKPYSVKIQAGLLGRIGEELLALKGAPCAVMLIADDQVDGLYGDQAAKALAESGFRVHRHVFPHGEEHKELETWQGMLCALAESRLTRTDLVVALGGGVTGDMAGFAAAAYLRGVSFVQIPTTLLAMVDSSVGGKTGINLPMGKNLAGAFHQPALVLCDPDTLQTLPPETLLDGVAEAIKTAVLGDAEMFSWFAAGDFAQRMEEVIARCVAIKASLVAQDERDQGLRQLLNLGHTIGHGVERLSHYGISHGKAVAMGMAFAARLASKLGVCGEDCPREIVAALAKCGLPAHCPYDPAALCDAALSDKKRAGDNLTFVLPKAIGQCVLYPVPVVELSQLLLAAAED